MSNLLIFLTFFLSIYISFGRERGLYVDTFTSILGTTVEDQVISFALQNKFTYMCLYDVGLILDNGRSVELAAFIFKAKSQGFPQIGAAGGWTGHFDLFASYQTKFASEPLKQLDVFNFESEFWNDPSPSTAFTKWISLVAYMKKSAGTSKLTEAYLGQTSSIITKSILSTIKKSGLNRLFLSCYSTKTDVANIMNNCRGVYDNLNSTVSLASPQNIYPLFSVEPDFFGSKINITQVEENFLTSFNSRYGKNTGMIIKGFMFFAYTEFLK